MSASHLSLRQRMKNCILSLTCAEVTEADKIAKTLLEKKLVVCVKKTAVSSSFLWKGSIDTSEEVLLIMDSVEENFQKIETEIRKIHSYETFVLISLPVSQTSQGVEDWMKKELESSHE